MKRRRVVIIESHRFCIARMSAGVSCRVRLWSCAVDGCGDFAVEAEPQAAATNARWKGGRGGVTGDGGEDDAAAAGQ